MPGPAMKGPKMPATLRIATQPAGQADHRLLGQNVELCLDLVPGLLSERLDNPCFYGAGDWQTRIAAGWQPAWHYNSPSVRFDLTLGMALSGWQSQLIHNHGGLEGGICQIGRYIRKGERLRVSLWARAQHRPVTLRVGLRPLKARLPHYGSATIQVDACYWKPYEAFLDAPADDQEAVFYCLLPSAGMVWIDQIHLQAAGDGHLRSETVEAFRSMRMGPLRFPGGHASSEYHWRCGTGPLHRRAHLPEAEFRFPEGMRYDFGTDEYLGLCRDLDIMPQITVNIGSGTPDEAGEWAAYCRQWWINQGLTPPAMYWQIGNETYLAQEVGNCTPEMYVQTLREFVPPIRANYPGARVIALGQESCFNAAGKDRLLWRQVVLDRAAPELYDLIDVHYYAGVPHDAAGPARQDALVKAAEGMLRCVTAAADDLAARGLDKLGKTVAITEWNLWHTACHHDGRGFFEKYDVEHGVFTAMMLNHWVRMTGRLELANFYNLLNVMGIILSKGSRFETTCVVDVFRLYREAFPGAVLPVEVQGPAIAGGTSPALDAVCLKGRTTHLMLVNRDGANAVEVELPRELGRTARVSLLSGGAPLDETFAVSSLEVESGRTLTLPPLSIARVAMAG